MRKRLGSIALLLAAPVAVGGLWVMHASEVGVALSRIAPGAIAAAVALHVATLALRSEAWRVTLAAAHPDVLSRGMVHAANAAAFVAGSVQSQAALPARVAMLRRFAGPRAPRPGVIFAADMPIFALELCATALLVCAAGVAGGAWWIALGAATLTVAVQGARHGASAARRGAQAAARAVAPGARRVVAPGAPRVAPAAPSTAGTRRLVPGAPRLAAPARRFAPRGHARWSFARGLAVLRDPRRRRVLATLVAAIVGLTLSRIWLVLAVCGLPHGFAEVVAVFAALGVFGLLPIGAGAGPASTVAVLGAGSAGASVAAGLLLGASSVIAVLAYALLVALRPRLPAYRRRGAVLTASPLPAGS